MDLKRACELLNIKPPFDMKQLRQKYHQSALQHHPDRNVGTNSSEMFQDIGSAYDFLSMWLEAETTDGPELDYGSMLDKFFGVLGEDRRIGKAEMNTLVDSLIHGCRHLSIKAFKDTDKDTAVKLFSYITRYSELLGLDEITISSMREIIREKTSEDHLVILNPSIDNLLNDEVYPLEHNGEVFYVPLWHDEITFDISGSALVVKCIPDVGKHIRVDEHSVLQVNVTTRCSKVFEDGAINVILGEKVFHIPSSEIKIQPFQTYTLNSVGIARIDTREMYNASEKSDIVFNITLTK
jgi:hypothetical protein